MIPYLLLINALGFVFMHWDKYLARKRHWRIPEVVLYLVAILGGSVGCVMGMNLFHHKTRKFGFRLPMLGILLVQLTLISVLIR